MDVHGSPWCRRSRCGALIGAKSRRHRHAELRTERADAQVSIPQRGRKQLDAIAHLLGFGSSCTSAMPEDECGAGGCSTVRLRCPLLPGRGRFDEGGVFSRRRQPRSATRWSMPVDRDDGDLHPVERLPQLVRRLGLSRAAELARTVDAWRTEIDTVLRAQPVGTRPSKRSAGGLRSRENSGLRMCFISIRKQQAVEHQIIGLPIRR